MKNLRLNLNFYKLSIIVILITLLSLTVKGYAQVPTSTVEIPSWALDFNTILPSELPLQESTFVDGVEKVLEDYNAVAAIVQPYPGAIWTQIQFDQNIDLPEGSFFTLVNPITGVTETISIKELNALGLPSSAFNGDTLGITIYTPKGFEVSTGQDFLDRLVKGVQVGDNLPENFFYNEPFNPGLFPLENERPFLSPPTQQPTGEISEESICDVEDNRVPYQDYRIGRIEPAGCTAWSIAENTFLTAGHCLRGGMDMVDFNVLPSNQTGRRQRSNPEDQYFIDSNTIVGRNNGVGDDWAIFALIDREHQLLPSEKTSEPSFTLLTEIPNSRFFLRISGFGKDSDPPGADGTFNSSNQILQTHTGIYLRGRSFSNRISHEYWVDTRQGNSGSPVAIINEDGSSNVAIAIHTHGECIGTEDTPRNQRSGNLGTSFQNPELRSALEIFSAQHNQTIIILDSY